MVQVQVEVQQVLETLSMMHKLRSHAAGAGAGGARDNEHEAYTMITWCRGR